MAGQYRFKDINGNIVAQISASSAGAIAFSGSAVDFSNASTITLGQVQLAGTASNALLLDGFDSTAFVFTSSFNTISQSISSQLTTLQTTSGSNIGRLNNLESKSSSVDISISNINTVTESVLSRTSNLESKSSSVDISISNINSVTASNIARLSNLETKSSSVDISITNINSVTASNLARLTNLETKSASVDISVSSINTFTASNNITSLNSKTGSYATTGSNTFFGTQTYSGSVYIANDLIVQGSSSIQYISASSVSIGTNIVQLNTANPSVRFAGLTIIDSGSIGGSGSFLYDSVHDEFVFVHRGNGTNVTSSHFVLGPETFDSLGNETYLTSNIIPKGTGKEHLVDSCIFDNGTTTCIKNNLIGTGTACFAGRICSPSITTDVVSTIGSSFTSPSAAGLGYGIFGYSGVGLGISATATGPNQGIGFFTCGDFERMRIVTSGNVGVGTSCPVRKMDIVATGEQLRLSYDGSVTYTDFRNDSAGGLLVNTSGQYIVNYINGCSKMRIDADAICFSTTICSPTIISSGTICSISNTCFGGNTIINGCVGMGTSTPTAKLHVYCAADVWHTRIGSACGELRIGGDTASGAVIQSYTPAGVVRDLYIQRDGGNVGIGTNNPEGKLHITGVNCGNYGTNLVLVNCATAVGTATGIDFGVDASTAGCGVGNAQIKVINTAASNASDMVFSLYDGSNFLERFRIKSNGVASFAYQVCAPTLEITSTNTNVYPRVNRSSTAYETGWKLATGGTDSWYTGLRSADGVGSYHFYSYTTNTSVVSIACGGTVTIGGGNLINSSNNKSHTFCQLTSAITKTFTTTGLTTGNFPVTDFSGIPSNAKALQVYGWYHITGYSQGAGQGDHAVTWFGINNDTSPYAYSTPGAAWPGSNSTFSAASYGSFAMEHDGDASLGSSSINYYGSWHNGIITVNSSGNVLYSLAQGLSGGTHYIALYVTGYWL